MARKPVPLEEAIRQTRPFRSPAHAAAVALMLTADMMRRRVERLLEPYGITAQQFNVLRILRGAGEKGLPTLTIAERMIEQTPGITRLIDRLEAKGLVKRERCLTDRRQVFCLISEPGRKLLERLDQPVARFDEEIMARLGQADQKRLRALLDEVRTAAE